MTRLSYAILLLAATWATAANGNPPDSLIKKPSRYYLSFRSAILPCSTCEMDGKVVGLLTTVHGFKINETFGIGVGAGLTSAGNIWLVPVFGNLRINAPREAHKRNRLFLDLNYGRGLAPTYREEFNYGGSQTTECRGYVQPSIGYSIAYYDIRIGIMIGLQSVKMTTKAEYPGYYYSNWAFASSMVPTPNVTEFEYAAKRLMVGVSIGWRD